MPKRFVDTERWKDHWYRKLPLKYKLFWNYICDNCDNSGMWKQDIDLASFQIGEEIDLQEAILLFNDKKQRVLLLNNCEYLLIYGFIDFQIGNLYQNKLTNLQKSAKKIMLKHIETKEVTENDFTIVTGSLPVTYGYKYIDIYNINNNISKYSRSSKNKEFEKKNVERKEDINIENAKKVIDYFNIKFSTKYRYEGEAFKMILDRIKEGYDLEDCLHVINTKSLDKYFIDNPKFLNLLTLFDKTKFEKYVFIPVPEEKRIMEKEKKIKEIENKVNKLNKKNKQKLINEVGKIYEEDTNIGIINKLVKFFEENKIETAEQALEIAENKQKQGKFLI